MISGGIKSAIYFFCKKNGEKLPGYYYFLWEHRFSEFPFLHTRPLRFWQLSEPFLNFAQSQSPFEDETIRVVTA